MFICTKCKYKIEYLLPVEDTDPVCPRCKSALNLVPDVGQEVKKKSMPVIWKRKNPFQYDTWKAKKEEKEKAESDALDEYTRTGNKGEYFKRLKQIKNEQRDTGTNGPEPGKV